MRFLYSLVLILLLSCDSNITENELSNLNGYWEITQVTFANGETKTFSTSTTIDYLEIENLKGFRKKVQPRLNGTFETSNDAKPFNLSKTKKGYDIQYPERNDQKKITVEHLIELSENSFSVKDQEGIAYVYKRFEPIIIKE